jgi:DNA polymerase-4
VLRARLRELTEQVGRRLRQAGVCGRTVQFKARFADFTTVTRAHTLAEPTDVTHELWQAVRQLFEQRLPPPHPPLRLIGMGVSGLTTERAPQRSLFDEEHQQQGRLDALVDAIHERFGASALSRGKSGR